MAKKDQKVSESEGKLEDFISKNYSSDDEVRFFQKKPDSYKPKIYMILTGGTLAQKRDASNLLMPYPCGNRDLIELIFEKGISNYVIDFADFGNIDSTEMVTAHRVWDNSWSGRENRPRTRVEIAEEIYNKLYDYTGFVITHGTDTMSYTAAALALMLRDLGKPIILTGAQKSVFESPSDGPSNIGWAIRCAAEDLAGVYIAFGDRLVTGPRAVKVDENGANAFDSPRVPPVGQFGANLRLFDHRTRRIDKDTTLFTDLSPQVVYWQLTSGVDDRIFAQLVDSEYVDGIVIGAFGAGNIQSYLIPHIEKATTLGKPTVISTNCLLGTTESIYAVGGAAIKAGAISAYDMTTEMAWTKLTYAIGRANSEKVADPTKKIDFVRRIIHTNYAGEITLPTEAGFESRA